jgi:hypothetical protein
MSIRRSRSTSVVLERRELAIKADGVHVCSSSTSELLRNLAHLTLHRSGQMEHFSYAAHRVTRANVVPSAQPVACQARHIVWLALDDNIVVINRHHLVDGRPILYDDAIPPYAKKLQNEIRAMREPGCCLYVLEFTHHYLLLNMRCDEHDAMQTIRRALRANTDPQTVDRTVCDLPPLQFQ